MFTRHLCCRMAGTLMYGSWLAKQWVAKYWEGTAAVPSGVCPAWILSCIWADALWGW